MYVPSLHWSSVECNLGRPSHSLYPHLSSNPIADEIQITIVNSDFDAIRQNAWNFITEGLNDVVSKERIDLIVASLPSDSLVVNSQTLLDSSRVEVVGDGRKVIAKRRRVALMLDVVDVQVSSIFENDAHNLTTDSGCLSPSLLINQSLASLESAINLLIGSGIDKSI